MPKIIEIKKLMKIIFDALNMQKMKEMIIAFGLPIFTILFIYLLWGQYPFGNNSLLIWDMDWQYISFFSHLHDILHGNASFFYTFSRAIGGEMVGILGYYMMSPFNLIFYFYNAENIYSGILLVTLLKIGASGACMYYFLSRGKNGLIYLIFSTAYALSAYVIAYSFNIFWMDSVILLPLMVCGIEKIVEEQKFLLYIIALTGGIIANFYMGYMLCIFSLLYFVCYFLFVTEKKKSFWILLLYGASSVASGLLSAGITLPMLYVLSKGKSASANLELILENGSKLFSYQSFIDGSFIGMINEEQITNGKPLIYCGVLTLMLAGYWFLVGGTKRKEKFAYLLLLFLLVMSLSHYNLNAIWHGFAIPGGSPYRYSFIYIFLMLLIACKGYLKLESRMQKEKYRKIIMGAIGIALTIILIVERNRIQQERRGGVFILNIIFIWSYFIIVLLNKTKMQVMICMCIMCVELICNAGYLYLFSEAYQGETIAEYKDYYQKIMPFIQMIKADDTFYRTILNGKAKRTENDSFMFNLYGLDSYTSVENIDTMKMAKSMGVNANMLFGIHYNNGTTTAGESLLGVKYYVTSEMQKNGFQLLKNQNGFYLYENFNVLPLAFLTDVSVLEIDNIDGSVFDYLNKIYQSICTNENRMIYEGVNRKVVDTKQCVQTVKGYQSIEGSDEAWVEYQIEVDSNKYIYLQYMDTGASRAELLFNNKSIKLEEQQKNFVKDLGLITPKDCVKLRFYIEDGQTFLPEYLLVYEEQREILASYANAVKNQNVNIRMETDSEIMIECTNRESETMYLMCSIPYDKGWHIEIDGNETDPKKVAGHFLAIPVEQGTHKVELQYLPKGLCSGVLISVWTVLLLCVILRKIRTPKS